jgi:hypothetical protein
VIVFECLMISAAVILWTAAYADQRETPGRSPTPAGASQFLLMRGAWSTLRSRCWRGWPEELVRVALALLWPVAILGALVTAVVERPGEQWPLLVAPWVAAYGTVGLALGLAGVSFRRWYGSGEGSGGVTLELVWTLTTLALATVGAAAAAAVWGGWRAVVDAVSTVLLLSPLLGLSALPATVLGELGRSPVPWVRRVPVLLQGLVFVALCTGLSWEGCLYRVPHAPAPNTVRSCSGCLPRGWRSMDPRGSSWRAHLARRLGLTEGGGDH